MHTLPSRKLSRLAAFSAALLPLSLALVAPRSAHAWGGEGHADVAHVAIASLPDPLKTFYAQNQQWLEEKSSYPDRWRNRPDKAEAPRHFFDSENFGFGLNLSQIPRRFGEVTKIRDYQKLRTDGINPWTVRRHYQLLISAFREKRWDDVMVQTAYLSHYVGDAHVPFHATSNYDGQLSQPSQKGIHSRFESQMVSRFIKPEELKAGAPETIGDPVEATFATIQEGANQVDPLLQADRDAAQAAGIDLANADRNAFRDKESYWTAFAEKARPIAVARLEKGGRTLAGFVVKAWQEAGKPALPSGFTMTDRLLPFAPSGGRGEDTPAQPPVSDEAKQTARSRAVTINIASKKLGKEVPATVLLPKDYETSGLRYPVLYLLHGAAGGNTDWNAKSGIAAYTADLPLIVVMPDATGNSFYTNSPKFGPVRDFYLEELIPTIDKQYRTLTKREGRAIAGLSMGGYGAWRLALDAPDKFQAAASLSGALFWGEGGASDPRLATFIQSIYGIEGTDEERQKRYAADALIPRIEKLTSEKNGYRGPALYFDCGSEDGLVSSNQIMEERLLDRGVPYEYAEFPGKHDWPYWDEHVRDALQFIQRQIAAPAK